MKMYKILFFNFTIMGTIITISAYSWFSMWMGLEINLLSIIPLMNSPKNTYPSESAIKYFITQTMASSILLFSILLIMTEIMMKFNLYTMIILNSAILTKMGAAPFHAWFPEVLEGLNWMNSLILLTWQKIAPMIILNMNLKINLFLISIIIMSTIISSIMGLNQISLRKIMAYSSINHIAWMITSMINQSVWILYFYIYTLISINIIIIFHNFNIFYINQLIYMEKNIKINKIILMFNFLSLGGLPPFLGFLPKWLTINYLIINKMYFISLILIIFTLITMYFYLRITFNSFLFKMSEPLMKSFNSLNLTWLIFNLIILMSLLICVLIFSFI
uniref:NADH-ubiquinone oxidoreductase chain 2 n=1 Tax=Cucujoidea sp. 2 KM-2017 TaxID=2219356 RepID=A0A346RJI4_9CUCU|nr:NADH dehydrogenase subunit 2 [Cucujoidea sp. 2 KM-2017]